MNHLIEALPICGRRVGETWIRSSGCPIDDGSDERSVGNRLSTVQALAVLLTMAYWTCIGLQESADGQASKTHAGVVDRWRVLAESLFLSWHSAVDDTMQAGNYYLNDLI